METSVERDTTKPISSESGGLDKSGLDSFPDHETNCEEVAVAAEPDVEAPAGSDSDDSEAAVYQVVDSLDDMVDSDDLLQDSTVERDEMERNEVEHDEAERDVTTIDDTTGYKDTGSGADDDGDMAEEAVDVLDDVVEDEAEEGEVEDEEDLKELERLAQKKLEILKAIEMPDSVSSSTSLLNSH